MNSYNSMQFSDIYKTPLGKDIWSFLNGHDNIIRMETASDLLRPAVEPLSKLLVLQFGKVIREDRMKQMIGHMVRQIMESRNYRLVSNNIKIRFGDLFTYASKYTRNN